MTDNAPAGGKVAQIIPPTDSIQAEGLRFERLLADLSVRFTNVRSEQFGSEIEAAHAKVRIPRCGA